MSRLLFFSSLCHSRSSSTTQTQFLQSAADREPETVCLGSVGADVSCLPDFGDIFVVVVVDFVCLFDSG